MVENVQLGAVRRAGVKNRAADAYSRLETGGTDITEFIGDSSEMTVSSIERRKTVIHDHRGKSDLSLSILSRCEDAFETINRAKHEELSLLGRIDASSNERNSNVDRVCTRTGFTSLIPS